MNDNTIQHQAPNIIDQAADTASKAIHHTQQATDQALGGLDHKVQALREQASPKLEDATHRVSAVAQQGVQSLRDTSRRLRESAQHVSEGTVQYVREEPVKSMLIAAATGAVLMGLATLLARSPR